MPLLDLDGEAIQLFTPLMRRVRAGSLKAPVGKLVLDRDRIVAAIDLLFAGS